MIQMTSCEKEAPDRKKRLSFARWLSELSSTAFEYFHPEWTVKTITST